MYCILLEGRWDEVKVVIEVELNVLGGNIIFKLLLFVFKVFGDIYIVKKGDIFFVIVKEYGVSVVNF